MAVSGFAAAVAAAGSGIAGVTIAGSAIYGAIAMAALAAAASYTSQSMARRAQEKAQRAATTPGSTTASFRNPAASRQIIYGKTRVGGPLAYLRGENGSVQMTVMLASHECTAIDEVWLDDYQVTLAQTASLLGRRTHVEWTEIEDPVNPGSMIQTPVEVVDDPGTVVTVWYDSGRYSVVRETIFAGFVCERTNLGASDQVVSPLLSNVTGGAWTSNHRLRGICHLPIVFYWLPDMFPNGVPNPSAVVRGKKLYDPRKDSTNGGSGAHRLNSPSTWEYSNNSALCLLDYLLDARLGLGATSAEIDFSSFAAAATICDQSVATVDGTEPRYTCNGVLTTEASHENNILSILSSMDGRLVYTGGRFRCFAGAYVAPAVTLTEDDLAGPIQVQTQQERSKVFNAARGEFASAETKWHRSDYPPYQSATLYAADQNEWLWADLPLPMTTSASTAQRLAKLAVMRSRKQIVVSAAWKLSAMQLMPGETVALTLARYGWSAKPFTVEEWKFNVSGEDGQLSVSMTLREIDEATFAWTAEEAATFASSPATTLPDPYDVDAPTGLALQAVASVAPDGSVATLIRALWSQSEDPYVTGNGRVTMQWKRSTETTWGAQRVALGSAFELYSDPVVAGRTYNVRVRFENTSGATSTWATANITPAGDLTPPGAPSSLTATVAVGAVRLDWTNPTDTDLAYVEVYEHTTDTRASATRIAKVAGTSYVRSGLAPNDLRYYWVRAVDTSGNVGAYNATAGVTTTSSVAAPASLSLAAASTIAEDGTVQSRVTATWPVSTDGYVLNGGAVRLEWKASTDASYGASVALAGGADTYVTPLLTPGTTYNFRVRRESSVGAVSSWATANVVAAGDTTAPGAPSGLTAAGSLGAIRLSWTLPADDDLAYTEVWEYTSNSRASATKIAQVAASSFTRAGLASGATRYYWIRCVDTSGNIGAYNATSGVAGTVGTVDNTDLASGITTVEIVSALPTSSNFAGRTVFLTTDNKLYRYTGSAFTAVVPAADITGTLADSQLAAIAASKVTGQLTDSQLAAIAAAKVTGTISSSQIADGSISGTKFASGLKPVEVVSTLPTTGNTQGRTVFLTTDNKLYRYTGTAFTAVVPAADVTGTLTDSQIADLAASKLTGQITSTQITDGAISTAKLAAGAVTAAKITANTITASEIAAGAITATTIAAGAVTTAKLAAGAVTANEIAANTITSGKIAAGAITATEIAASAITTAKIAAGAVTATEIAASAVTTAKISAGAITTATIAAGAVTATEIAAGSVTTAKIAAGAITATEIAASAVTTAKLATGAVTADTIAAGAITTAKLAAGSVTADKIDVVNLVAQKFQSATTGYRLEINPAGNTAGKIVTYDGKGSITADIGIVTGTSISGVARFNRAKDANSTQTGYGIDVDYSVHNRIFSGSTFGAHGYGVGIDIKHTGDVAGYFESTDRDGIKVKGSTATGYYDIRCEGSGKLLAGSTVLPFTGAHEALIAPGAGAEIGDIVVDVELLAKEGVSNTLFRVALSDTPNQRAAVGIVSSEPSPWSLDTSPYLLRVPAPEPAPPSPDAPWPADARTGYVWRDAAYAELVEHEYLLVNAVGEGQLNVCGEGGDIAAGDLIVTSSMPGKGMKQADDVVRSYTVARARESVTFSDPAEVRQIACIYLCG